jgi:hypothetical protein
MVQEIISTYLPIIISWLQDVWHRMIEIVLSPIHTLEMLWLLIPLLLTLFLMELYFGRYKDEELGWNTAFGNVIILLFVAAYLANHIYTNELYFNSTKVTVAATVVLAGIILMIIDFYHLLPKKIAFQISSKLPINFLAFSAIILVYTNIPIDYITLYAFIGILLGLSIFIGLIHVLSPHVREKFLPKPPSPTKKKLKAPEYDGST